MEQSTGTPLARWRTRSTPLAVAKEINRQKLQINYKKNNITCKNIIIY